MKNLLPTTLLMACLAILSTLIICCSPSNNDASQSATADTHSNYSIASEDYEELAEKALNLVGSFEFDDWYEMLAEDVEYYFPDGDVETRTRLIGKEAVVEFWNNYLEASGNTKMAFSNFVHIPVNVNEALNYTGLTGVIVLSYFSAEMSYGESTTNVRMNFATHFNDEKKIDRYYTYYDRSPIIEAAQMNILTE